MVALFGSSFELWEVFAHPFLVFSGFGDGETVFVAGYYGAVDEDADVVCVDLWGLGLLVLGRRMEGGGWKVEGRILEWGCSWELK